MRVLFASTLCLFDPASGAMRSCRDMLAALARAGHEIRSVTTTCLDRPVTPSVNVFLAGIGASLPDPRRLPRLEADGGIHVLVPVATMLRPTMMAREEERYFNRVVRQMEERRPDVILGVGPGAADRALWRAAAARGIPVVLYVSNLSVRSPDMTRDAALVITDSAFTADHCRRVLGVEARAVGKFMQPVSVPAGARPSYCLVINPEPQKGGRLALDIMWRVSQVAPDIRFAVVESRFTVDELLAVSGDRRGPPPNLACLPQHPDLSAAWAGARTLLHLSLWPESGSRVVMEALSAGIPVLATEIGGVPEMLNGGGLLRPVPMETGADHLRPADLSTVTAWADDLVRLQTDAAWYAACSARARAAWRDHPARDRLDLLELALRDATAVAVQGRSAADTGP